MMFFLEASSYLTAISLLLLSLIRGGSDYRS